MKHKLISIFFIINLMCILFFQCNNNDNDNGNENTETIEFLEENYPECTSYINDENPEVCNGIIRFNCGEEVDGALYFFNFDDLSIISTCGGICLLPQGEQIEVCLTLCPPQDYDCE